MNYKDISEAVKEQLGIEEDEDPLELVSVDTMKDEIKVLKHEIRSKNEYISELELAVDCLSKRMDTLEKVVYEFKSREVEK